MRRRQISLPQSNIAPEFVEKDGTHIGHDDHGEDQMGPIAIGVLGSDISPRQLIQTPDVVLDPVHRGGISPAGLIEREEDGEDDEGEGEEDFEKHAQITEKEKGIETTFLYKLRVGGSEDGGDPSKQAGWRGSGALALRD